MTSPGTRRLPDGMIELENEHLRVRLDPGQAGTAWSILDKRSGKDVALCQGYRGRLHPALFEILAGQPLSEGRVDARPLPYTLRDLRIDEIGAATASFTGYPAGPTHPRVRLEKTCRLAPGRTQVQVDLAFVNETEVPLPLAAWVSSGLRIHDEDCEVFSPSSSGTIQTPAPWHSPASMSVNIPRAAAGWTAAVSRGAPHLADIRAGP